MTLLEAREMSISQLTTIVFSSNLNLTFDSIYLKLMFFKMVYIQ